MGSLLPQFNISEAGYISILDVGGYYTGTEVETALQEIGALPSFTISNTDITNWDTAYSWGNHASAGYLVASNNLSDLTNAATARTNLGLVAGGAGDIWVEKAGDTMTGTLRNDSGYSYGAAVTSTQFNYFTKSLFSSLASPTLIYQNLSLSTGSGNTGFAAVQSVNLTLASGASSSAGLAAIFGFTNLSTGTTTGTAAGLRYFVREQRSNSYTATVGAGIDSTFQFNSTANLTYSGATYAVLAQYSDFTSVNSPTTPWAVHYGIGDIVGNATISTFKAGLWLNFSTTASANIAAHYGIRIEAVQQGVNNYAVSLEGTGAQNGVFFNARNVNLYANSTTELKTDDLFTAVGKIRSDDKFNVNGTDGVTTTFDPATVTSITVTGGIITAVS